MKTIAFFFPLLVSLGTTPLLAFDVSDRQLIEAVEFEPTQNADYSLYMLLFDDIFETEIVTKIQKELYAPFTPQNSRNFSGLIGGACSKISNTFFSLATNLGKELSQNDEELLQKLEVMKEKLETANSANPISLGDLAAITSYGFARIAEECLDLSNNSVLNRDQTPSFILCSNVAPTFHELRLENGDKDNISFIINTMAEHNKATLLLKYQSKLKKTGEKVNEHVHPLRFIAYVQNNQRTKRNLREKIARDGFKWHSFISGFGSNLGFGDRMDKERKHGNLEAYLPEFCQMTRSDIATVKRFIHTKDWDGFVRYILSL